MGNSRLEDAIGIVDGVNLDFTTPAEYTAGTLEVWLNGQLKRQQDDDGWDETGVDSFRMKEPPLTGDIVRVFFVDTLESTVGPVVETLVACLDEIDILCGVISTDSLTACLVESDDFCGTFSVDDTLCGLIDDTDELCATMIDCDE